MYVSMLTASMLGAVGLGLMSPRVQCWRAAIVVVQAAELSSYYSYPYLPISAELPTDVSAISCRSTHIAMKAFGNSLALPARQYAEFKFSLPTTKSSTLDTD